MSFRDVLLPRAQSYAQRHGLVLTKELGFGVHGIVLVSECQPEKDFPPERSAIKVHHREVFYARERDVYLRLQEQGVESIRGCTVPRLLRHDNELWILEMSVVTPPYVLDFGGAYLDKAPDFSEEVLAEWHVEKREQFVSKWPEVQAILRHLESFGVIMQDVNPGNIAFPD